MSRHGKQYPKKYTRSSNPAGTSHDQRYRVEVGGDGTMSREPMANDLHDPEQAFLATVRAGLHAYLEDVKLEARVEMFKSVSAMVEVWQDQVQRWVDGDSTQREIWVASCAIDIMKSLSDSIQQGKRFDYQKDFGPIPCAKDEDAEAVEGPGIDSEKIIKLMMMAGTRSEGRIAWWSIEDIAEGLKVSLGVGDDDMDEFIEYLSGEMKAMEKSGLVAYMAPNVALGVNGPNGCAGYWVAQDDAAARLGIKEWSPLPDERLQGQLIRLLTSNTREDGSFAPWTPNALRYAMNGRHTMNEEGLYEELFDVEGVRKVWIFGKLNYVMVARLDHDGLSREEHEVQDIIARLMFKEQDPRRAWTADEVLEFYKEALSQHESEDGHRSWGQGDSFARIVKQMCIAGDLYSIPASPGGWPKEERFLVTRRITGDEVEG